MTDEELSELEEFIDMQCKVAVSEGRDIMFGVTYDHMSCCPIGAAARRCNLTSAAVELGVTQEFAENFAWAFDRDTDYAGPDYAMGRRFRERVLAGEYSKS